MNVTLTTNALIKRLALIIVALTHAENLSAHVVKMQFVLLLLIQLFACAQLVGQDMLMSTVFNVR